jgi:imidazoleglycerol phosphate dehydratase HisB
MHAGSWYKPLDEEHHQEYVDISGRTILKLSLENGYMDWIHLAQDRYKWRTLVNTVMDFQFA